MDSVKSAYNQLFYERADARVKDWLYMSSPVPLIATIAAYLVLIKLLLPAYMKNRKPYKLKGIIKWYNVVQIIVNTIVTWGLLTSGWTTTYRYGCILPNYSMDPQAVRMLRYMWWTFCLKLIELVETAFFVLRKRDRQASFLHMYHHVSTLIIIWTGVKFVGGGSASFSPLINNSVHIIMYSYYLLSSEGSPKLKEFLAKYKKWLTIVQMIQFTLIIIYLIPILLPSCQLHKGFPIMFAFNVLFVFYMFIKFYKQNYSKKQDKNGISKSR